MWGKLVEPFAEALAGRLAKFSERFPEMFDWIDLMTGLSDGSGIYRAMFDTAPLAHHEGVGTAKPA